MTVIESFVEKYKEEYDFYQRLAITAKDLLEKEIYNRGIKAIVTYRTKKVDSLIEKLRRRNEKKHYQIPEDIERDIVDLAGIRVALYFPSDRRVLDKTIEKLFDVVAKKEFPTDPQSPKLNKRFSGYWASHYRVRLKGKKVHEERLTTKIIEIQVASVLMHAWSEVEHDLVYKPVSGAVSDDELAILDEINGLVMAGEIALERLQKAYAERTKRKKEITDRYQLSMLVLNNFKNLDLSTVELGDTSILNNYLEAVSKMDTEEVLKSFEKVKFNFSETITDQVLTEIINKDYDKNLKKYLASFTDDEGKVTAYEAFLKAWIILDKAVECYNGKDRLPIDGQTNYYMMSFANFTEFTDVEMEELRELRILRSKLLHGFNSISPDDLKPSFHRLKEFCVLIISKLPDGDFKEKLGRKLGKLANLMA